MPEESKAHLSGEIHLSMGLLYSLQKVEIGHTKLCIYEIKEEITDDKKMNKLVC